MTSSTRRCKSIALSKPWARTNCLDSNVAMWSVPEPGLGIIAGNIATLRPLAKSLDFGISSSKKYISDKLSHESKRWSRRKSRLMMGGRLSDSHPRGYVMRPASNSLEIQLIEARTSSGKYNINHVEYRAWDEEAGLPQRPSRTFASPWLLELYDDVFRCHITRNFIEYLDNSSTQLALVNFLGGPLSHDVSKIWILLIGEVQEGKFSPFGLVFNDCCLPFLVLPFQDEEECTRRQDCDAIAIMNKWSA